MDIIFVRHGKTEMNEKKKLGGVMDSPLSQAGIEEARVAEQFIRGMEFGRIYMSPLKRAMQTAEIFKVSGETDDRLKEMNFGIFEGLSYEEASRKYPAEAKRWEEDFINYRIPDGESLMDVYERAADFMHSVSEEKGPVLVVTHAGIINCALCSIFGSPEYYYRFSAAHCRFTQISLERGFKYIKAVNAAELY
ncbi:MAG: histidine phosphatase family protein [Clostridiaceae bacterium]